MAINAVELKKLIEIELASVLNHQIIDHIRRFLVEPTITMRGWDYGDPGEEYPCWTVLSDSIVAIAYCEQGFGPRCPWGLVFMNEEAGFTSIGMDSGWFPTFLEAFFDSPASTLLPIWQVFKIASAPLRMEAITGELEWDAAWRKCKELRVADPSSNYLVSQPLHP